MSQPIITDARRSRNKFGHLILRCTGYFINLPLCQLTQKNSKTDKELSRLEDSVWFSHY